MNTTVSTPVTMVITVCMRMIRSKPITPPKMVSATTTISAMTLVAVPPPQPSRSNTVAVASVARMISTVSQPTVSSQEIADGSLLPLTPNAARLEHHRRRRAPLAGHRDEPAEQEREDDPDHADHHRLPERDPEAEHERAVAEAEHRDVGARTTARTGRVGGPCARHRR